MNQRNLIVALLSLLVIPSVAEALVPSGGKGIDVKNIDTTVSPAKDFFLYSNGKWIENNPVPESESRWSSFDEVKTANQKELYKIMEKLSAEGAVPNKKVPDYVNANKKLLGKFYASGMASALQERGTPELVRTLSKSIDQMNDPRELTKMMTQFVRFGINPLFSIYAGADMNNSSVVTLYLGQGGLSMPDRDYYLSAADDKVAIRREFVNHVLTVMTMFGEDPGRVGDQAEVVLQMEKELADASMNRTDLRDPYKTNNQYMIDQMLELTPDIDWRTLVLSLGVDKGESVIINNPQFFRHLGRMIPMYKMEEWKWFMKWKLYRHVLPYISESFRKEHFRFNEQVIKGVPNMQERWKFVLETINSTMGDALGQVYCESFYDEQADARMKSLIDNVKSAFRDRLMSLEWMSSDTRKYAVLKLDSMVWKIGKPKQWRDYSTVNVTDNFCENILSLTAFEVNRKLSRVGLPVDRDEWRISASTVNAYYSALQNEIVFPAGILQPPFFDKNADDAVIYGAIGAVIGHEIIHGFDDQGRKFDYKGNLHNWWTEKDSVAFYGIANKIVNQYSGYTVNGDLKVNGKLTLGENIADIGGLAIAYQAFQYAKKTNPSSAKIDGYTPDQRFFLSFAQVWRNTIRPEEAARRILVDPHSPGKYRCNGTVTNMNAFYDSFNVKEGDAMYKPKGERIVIW